MRYKLVKNNNINYKAVILNREKSLGRGRTFTSSQFFATKVDNMADKKAELAAKKVAELNKELDEYIESVKKKADGKKREPQITEENWEEVG